MLGCTLCYEDAGRCRLTPDAQQPRLVRAIGRWDLTASVVNGTIGSSIFGMPAVLAALTGAWSPLAALFAGLGILTITLCHAEVASRFKEPGGTYLYAREAYGRSIGFQAGWLSFWIRVTSMGANLNVFVDYLGQFAPAVAAGPGRAAVMGVVAALVTALNVSGVRLGARTVDLFTVAKLLPLILLVVLGVGRISEEVLATQAVAAPDWTQAVLLLIFAYGGFEAALIPASEAKDPRRDSAFALLTALAIVAGTYMLVQLTVVGLVPQVATTRAPVAAAFGVLLGPAGVTFAILAAMISTSGWTIGAVLNSPRILYSMGERGELPAILARVHPRFRTPDAAIYVFAAAGLAFALSGGFAANATISAIIRLVTYAMVCSTVPVFRRRPAMEAPGFRIPGGSAVAMVGLAFCLWLLSTRTFTQAWILVAMMVAGWLLSLLAGRKPAPVPAA
jgi:APA family basic amino acid/polyamine antiporter